MVGFPKNALVTSAIKSLWGDKMTVVGKVEIKGPASAITNFEDEELYLNVPCRVSFKTVVSATDENLAKQGQSIKVYCDSSLEIPPGSILKIELEHKQGVITEYKQSGKPAIYSVHQEIPVELVKEYA